MHQLREILVGDHPEAWAAAGFSVRDATVRLGEVRLRLCGPDGGRGMASIAVDGIADDLDGVATHAGSAGVDPSAGLAHPNRVDAIDHLVVTTPDSDRTTTALESAGLEVRRVRRFEAGGKARRQTFFWLGRVILELMGPEEATGDGPARPWGLALTSADLDATVSWLGPQCSSARPAVQESRRIATIRTDELDISVPLAVMSPHPR